MKLKTAGYVVVQETMKKEFLDRLAEKESREEVRDSQQACIENLATQVENSGLDTMGFKHVSLAGLLIDFVASSDDVAVLFAVLPPETDYTASVEEGDGDPPKKTFECIGPNNAVSPRLFELLAKCKEALRALEKDAEIRLAILASMSTINSMRRSWKDRIKESDVKLVSHEFFLDYLRSVFPALSEDADEDGDEDKSPSGNEDGDEDETPSEDEGEDETPPEDGDED